MCAGDEIYANANSILGSIGVIYSAFGFQELIKKIGVQENWMNRIDTEMRQLNHKPHVIILEIFDAANKEPGYSGMVKNKLTEFSAKPFSTTLN